MLRITRQTDYGIVLLTQYVGRAPGASFAAKDLASLTRLPVPMVSKILKLLAKDGLLESQRGAKGGYSLAVPPTNISVARVIAALEGPISMTHCVSVDDRGRETECENTEHCPVRPNWQRINQVVQDALARVTIAEMVSDPANCGPTANFLKALEQLSEAHAS